MVSTGEPLTPKRGRERERSNDPPVPASQINFTVLGSERIVSAGISSSFVTTTEHPSGNLARMSFVLVFSRKAQPPTTSSRAPKDKDPS